MHRRTLLQAAFGKSPRRPNFVFVLVDQWRAQAFGYRGDPNAHTPAIDRLARESFQFPNALSGLPVCSPYRASLLTGQYAVNNGVVINDVDFQPPKGSTLGERFQQAGYATGYIGKWHLFGSPQGKAERRLDPVPPDRRLGFDHWEVCECTHNYNRSLYYAGNDTTQRYWPGYDAMAQTASACRWLEARSKQSDPFFLLLSLGPPHDPYQTAPEKYMARYRNRELQLRENVPASHREEALKNLRGYYAHVAALDDCMAQLRSCLAKLPQAEDTVLVFCSDHGDMLQSHGMHHKQQPWEESLRVPFLVNYPRRLRNRPGTAQTPLDAVDILPTLLGLAGLPPQDSAQGKNLAPVILGEKKEEKAPSALLNLPVSFSVVRQQGFAEYRGVATLEHTYVRTHAGPWLLYDNRKDPFQKQNLAMRETKLVKRLDALLNQRLKAAKDDFLPGARYTEKFGLAHYRPLHLPVGEARSPWGDWQATWGSVHGSR
ncbi:MAG: sulfatase [Bryobacter sp.]|nr:sulfatase [Bryobacter sp.]